MIRTTASTVASLRPLQSSGVEFVGGSPLLVTAAFVTYLLAVVLSVLVAYRVFERYRRTRRRPMLLLATGLVLLAVAPMVLRLWFANVAYVDATTRTFVVALTELCGLLVILYVVYEP